MHLLILKIIYTIFYTCRDAKYISVTSFFSLTLKETHVSKIQVPELLNPPTHTPGTMFIWYGALTIKSFSHRHYYYVRRLLNSNNKKTRRNDYLYRHEKFPPAWLFQTELVFGSKEYSESVTYVRRNEWNKEREDSYHR